jgi:hypothetical protein
MLSRSQIETLTDNTLSDNRNPLTRGGELNTLVKELISAVFEFKQRYIKTCSNVSTVTVLQDEHLLPYINGIRCEDGSGNEIFIPNKIDRTANSVTVNATSSISFKLIIF